MSLKWLTSMVFSGFPIEAGKKNLKFNMVHLKFEVPGKGDSELGNPSFSGSMLNFGGVFVKNPYFLPYIVGIYGLKLKSRWHSHSPYILLYFRTLY